VAGLLQRRFQIINIWRPISHPAYDWPLTLCDYRSVNPEEDVFAVPIELPNDRKGELLAVKYNKNQKWNYFYGLTPDEGILIKW
jgi:hypothetical protein